jgi:hypothetical protein
LIASLGKFDAIIAMAMIASCPAHGFAIIITSINMLRL